MLYSKLLHIICIVYICIVVVNAKSEWFVNILLMLLCNYVTVL